MYRLLCCLACLAGGLYSYSQVPAETLKKMIDEKSFVFHANSVLPTGGRSRQLTTEYTLVIKRDSVVADLPYFGRVYNVDYGNTNGGYDFVSTRFEYSAVPRKKGGWTINIRLKDRNDPGRITLFISETGNTSVNIISTNRQPISYSGIIVKDDRN